MQTIRELAEQSGLTYWRIRKLIMNGELKTKSLGFHTKQLIDENEFYDLIKKKGWNNEN